MRRTINTKNSSFDQGYVGELGMRGRLILRIRRLIRDVSDYLECVGRLILRIRRLTRDVSDNLECVGRLILRIRRLTRDVSDN